MVLREQLAELAHEQWSGWMHYLFSKGTYNDDGTWTMPEWAVNRWVIQMGTPYGKLSEEEKESDRKEADKFWAVFEKAIKNSKKGCKFCKGWTQTSTHNFCQKCGRFLLPA